MTFLTFATGDWCINLTAFETFKNNFKFPINLLPQKDETRFEARGVINTVMNGVQGTIMTRTCNWFMSWFCNPITIFTVLCVGSGRGSSQYSTWTVTVDYLTGRVQDAVIIHSSNASGFPKEGAPNFSSMRTYILQHVGLNPDYVLVWGSAYYVANKNYRFPDGGRFSPSIM